MKRFPLQGAMVLVFLLAGVAQANAQCAGPMMVPIQGAGTGLSLSASETHINAQCPADNGSATISATGGTTPYMGVGTFPQPVGTQTYTVVDAMGCTATVSVTITSNPRPTGFISGSATVCLGFPTTLTLSVTGSGTISGMLSDGTSFSGTAPTILVNVTPAITTTYTISSLFDANCASIPADLTGSATVVVLTCSFISGKLIWEGDRLTFMTGVNVATVNLTGDDTDTDITGIPGLYDLFADMGNDFVITPKKNQGMPNAMNGVTSADASRIQQHVTGILKITDPYKLIAADINKSNTISSTDATIIQQALLGNPAAQQYFINNTWRFVPKAYVFPTPTNPFVPVFPEKIIITGMTGNIPGQDFIGAKIGDVNNTANPAILPSGSIPDLVWKVQDQELVQDGRVIAEFRMENFDDLLALQFGLQFDQTKVELVEIEAIAGSPFQVGNFGTFNILSGEIRAVLAMSEGKTLPNGTPGFRLKFKVLQGGDKLSDVLQLSNAVLLGECYTSIYTPGPVELVYEGIATGTNEPEAGTFKLLQNQPNPFSESTTIEFELPRACDATLRVFDVNGGLLREHTARYPAGRNAEAFDFGTDIAGGILYYELKTPFGVLAKKMVLAGR